MDWTSSTVISDLYVVIILKICGLLKNYTIYRSPRKHDHSIWIISHAKPETTVSLLDDGSLIDTFVCAHNRRIHSDTAVLSEVLG
jgi:hypothetical protein